MIETTRRPAWARNLLLISAFVACAGGARAETVTDIVIPGERVFPESLTSSADGRIYIGSLTEGVIYRADPGSPQAVRWVEAGSGGLKSVFGVLADEKSKTLWACSGTAGPPSGAPVPGALHGFDLETGEPKGRYEFPTAGAACNDIAVGEDGTVYATDTANQQVVRLNRKSKSLQVWAGDGKFGAPGAVLDGIAFAGPTNLYVNTLVTGKIFRIDVLPSGKAGKVTEIVLERPLTQPDGMRTLSDNSLLVVEVPGRLSRLTFNGKKARVETLKEGFNGPASVTVVGRTAYVLEGQLSLLMRPNPNAKPTPFRAVAVPLN